MKEKIALLFLVVVALLTVPVSHASAVTSTKNMIQSAITILS